MIRQIELFKDLNESEIAVLSEIITEKDFQSGEMIFEEHQVRQAMYLVVTGRVELVKRDVYGIDQVLRIFENNDFMGEGSLLDDFPHSTSTRAIEPTKTLVINRVEFDKLLATHPALVHKTLARISRVISRRMSLTTTMVVGASAQYVSGKTRHEHDLLGEREVPFEHYYGIQTLRALENFNITGVTIGHYPSIIIALAQVKSASAKANYELGLIPEKMKNAIVRACEELKNGKYHVHFVVDMVQGGAGTSTNMNANEVIANRALELMGYQRGQYEHCHPNEHINMSQSTNDVYPTAIKLGLVYDMKKLEKTLLSLIESFSKKAAEFKNVIKMGRTQLQDAVPMTLGQEFSAYAVTLEEEVLRLHENSKLFLEINMGGTAIGTGINADPRYSELVTKYLCEETDMPLVLAHDLIEATQDTGSFVMFSSAVKRLAVKLSKICNDLRLLSSGPRTGLGEINLPPMQPGSSIMPGKVNPVIPEVVNQIAFKVIGNDITVTMAAEAGQLQLNVMEPIIAQSIFESMEMLTNGMMTLKYRCIDGITANEEHCRDLVYNSIGLVTALNPILGYEIATKLAKDALSSRKSVYDLVLESNYMSKEQLDEVLKPENMLRPITIERKF
ncbi:MAG: aspartate ammonia-lyase [Ignavibacteriae bacterium HGW-Ignavibacteriae-1]|nr:MAG: aspartate ammonia-lyase [Ignavibacteriae bacterium HGW-Ignavibacteriae-1]